MCRTAALFSLALAAALALPAVAAAERVPAWVELVELPTAGEPAEGATKQWLLVDTQYRFARGQRERFYRYAVRVLDDEAAAEEASVWIGFHPQRQRAALHFVRRIRGGQQADLTASLEVTRDRELGQLAAPIDDLQPGDVLDIAYSVSGDDSLAPGRIAGADAVQFVDPVARSRWRLVAAADASVRVRPVGIEAELRVTRDRAVVEHAFDLAPSPAVQIPDGAPNWHAAAQGVVSFTDFASWDELAAWASAQFPVPSAAGVPGELIQQLRASGESEAALARAAVEHVRDQPQGYGGISYVPRPPATTLAEGGDAEDRAQLLASLLVALGIDARVALVRRGADPILIDRLPVPGLFDHAVVRAELDGRLHWLDPAAGATADPLAPPRYHNALVLYADGPSIAGMPLVGPERATYVVTEHFEVGGQRDTDASVSIATRYAGSEASAFRDRMPEDGLPGLEQQLLEYYRAWDEDLERTRPLRMRDDEADNIVTLEESYRLPRFWNGDRHDFDAREVNNVLPIPEDGRSAPLTLPFPVHYEYTIRIDIPIELEWSIDPVEIDNEYFTFTFDERPQPGGGMLVYTLQTHTDHVPAAAIAHYRAELARIEDYGGYYLTNAWYTDPDAPAPERSPVALVLGGLLVAVFGAGLVYSAREQLRMRRR